MSRCVYVLAALSLMAAIVPAPAPSHMMGWDRPTLRNGGLEGPATPENGFELFFPGAALAPFEGREGSQAVNLAVPGTEPREWSTVGTLRVRPAGNVTLADIEIFAFHLRVPATPEDPIAYQFYFNLDLDNDGIRDECLVHTPRNQDLSLAFLEALPEWTAFTFDDSTLVRMGGPTCAASPAEIPLATFKAIPLAQSMRVMGVVFQTYVPVVKTWTSVPVFVDDLDLRVPDPVGALDGDLDGIPTGFDNCPAAKNTEQDDRDDDGTGDACDDDEDGDTIPDARDNCPTTSNRAQDDDDGDGRGNACDPTPFGSPEPAPTSQPERPGPVPSESPRPAPASDPCAMRPCEAVPPPAIREVTLDASRTTATVAWRVEGTAAARSTLNVGGESIERVGAGQHRVLVTDLQPGSPHTVTIEVRDSGGEAEWTGEIQTVAESGPEPAGAPAARVRPPRANAPGLEPAGLLVVAALGVVFARRRD